MKIALDGFGGDHAPLAMLEGAALAVAEYGVEVVITGDESVLKRTAVEHNIPLAGLHFSDTKDVIDICEEPTTLLQEHRDSSLGRAFTLLAQGEVDALVSAGSTGAIVVGGTFLIKRIKGIKRAAIASMVPCENGSYLLVDAGANTDCRPEMLHQFAIMGSMYLEAVRGIHRPRVGLVNIGAEETKGGQLQKDTYHLLEQDKNLNFTGNLEARGIPLGEADVVVCDGFTGNVILKLSEGWGKFLNNTLKDLFLSGFAGKFSAALLLKKISGLRKRMNYKEYGGAPLLGVTKPVIKAHGSSDKLAISKAIYQAKLVVEQQMIARITKALADQKEER